MTNFEPQFESRGMGFYTKESLIWLDTSDIQLGLFEPLSEESKTPHEMYLGIKLLLNGEEKGVAIISPNLIVAAMNFINDRYKLLFGESHDL